MTFTHTRNALGRLLATCDRCLQQKAGTQPAVSRWQLEHSQKCPSAARPSTAAS